MPAEEKEELQHPTKVSGGLPRAPPPAAAAGRGARPGAALPRLCTVAAPRHTCSCLAAGPRCVCRCCVPAAPATAVPACSGAPPLRPLSAILPCFRCLQVQVSNSPVYTTGRRLGKGGFGQVRALHSGRFLGRPLVQPVPNGR